MVVQAAQAQGAVRVGRVGVVQSPAVLGGGRQPAVRTDPAEVPRAVCRPIAARIAPPARSANGGAPGRGRPCSAPSAAVSAAAPRWVSGARAVRGGPAGRGRRPTRDPSGRRRGGLARGPPSGARWAPYGPWPPGTPGRAHGSPRRVAHPGGRRCGAGEGRGGLPGAKASGVRPPVVRRHVVPHRSGWVPRRSRARRGAARGGTRGHGVAHQRSASRVSAARAGFVLESGRFLHTIRR